MLVMSMGEHADIEGHFTEDFRSKVKVTDDTRSEEEQEKPPQQKEAEEEVEEEFSFVPTNPDGSPISADDILHNGQIRPVFPLFDRTLLFTNTGGHADSESKSSAALRPPLKKLFVEERNQASSSTEEQEESEGPYCVWRGKAVDATPEVCKKSNSTGFSKLWRFRERAQLRSNSDGKDAFVFLNHQNHNTFPSPPPPPSSGKKTETSEKVVEEEKKVVEKKEVGVVKKGKRGVKVSSWSAHERHYVRNRMMKEGEKRKSYLPYRPELVGFFTNVNGLSSNVHPF